MFIFIYFFMLLFLLLILNEKPTQFNDLFL